uniref:Gnk2-homologous domain-containing protein n=1 Tax=Quercus lobata TaxID=97700 RepID=A0A7N2MVE3_QUELO
MGFHFVVVMLVPQTARLVLMRLAVKFLTPARIIKVQLYVGELDYAVGGSYKLYGLVQCTRDLSSNDCFKCLDGMIGELPDCCNGKVGGRVATGSCNIRNEVYPFFSF